jgi:oxygen-independent coproporphyrinogen-3 oxidase
MARRNGFGNINIDLIFAIPGSNLRTWQYTLAQAIDLAVEHIAAYSLSYEKNTPFSRKRDIGEIEPLGEDDDRLMYEMACDMLAEASFGQYEISNFAKENYQCQHNLIYWSNKPYIGIGPAAGSYWDGCRKLNIADVGRYMAAIEQGETVIAESEKPSPDEITCQTAILMLRRTRGIDFLEFEQRTGRNAMELFAQTIEHYSKIGLLIANGSSVRLTPEGMAVADSVMCDFSGV